MQAAPLHLAICDGVRAVMSRIWPRLQVRRGEESRMQRWVPAASACAWFLSCALLPAASVRAATSSSSESFPISSDYLRGIDALDHGRLGEAIAALERVVAAEPDFSGARMDLARAQFASGNYARADSEFRYLLAQAPPTRVRAVIQRYLDAIPGRSLLASS